MSAVLGPIHYWLYHKIQLQESLIRRVVETAEEKGWPELEENGLREASVSNEFRPLEELIDVGNIHGWLQDRIHDAEGRYARLVTALTADHPERLTVLGEAAFAFGAENAVAGDTTVEEAYKALDDSLLNGMPCQRVNIITDQAEGRIAWTQTQDIHREYWEAAGGDPDMYYALREKLIQGMLSQSGLTFETLSPDSYAIHS